MPLPCSAISWRLASDVRLSVMASHFCPGAIPGAFFSGRLRRRDRRHTVTCDRGQRDAVLSSNLVMSVIGVDDRVVLASQSERP
jgi:hypothetical protein